MRKTRSRKRTNKKRSHKRSTYKRSTYKRSTRRIRYIRGVRHGGSITTPMVGSLEGEDHKGLGKIVVAGPMGVMSGRAYLESMETLDRQGAE